MCEHPPVVNRQKTWLSFQEPLNLPIIARMEGTDFSWAEIMKDSDYNYFSQKFPSIYTNHWLNNADRFKQLQLPYMGKRVSKIIQLLHLQPSDSFVDLSDENHNLVAEVRNQIQFDDNSFCIGMPLESLPECMVEPGVVPLYSNSWKFTHDETYFDRFKINKVFASDLTLSAYKDHLEFLFLLKKRLSPGSKILISYRPEFTYLPLFESARKEMARTQISTEKLRALIRHAGFNDVRIELEHYSTTIERETWLAMIRSRYFGCLENFSAAEVETGIELEIQPKFQNPTDSITFKDSFVYVLIDVP